MATTHSPTRAASESANFAGTRPVASTLTTARSVAGSRPTSRAGRERPSRRRTLMVSASSTTWLFVRIAPSAVKTTPEPMPRAIGSSPAPRPKKRENMSAFSSRAVTSICTTLGPTRSATATNPSDRRRASAVDACTWAGEGAGAGCGPLPARPRGRRWRCCGCCRSTVAASARAPATPARRGGEPEAEGKDSGRRSSSDRSANLAGPACTTRDQGAPRARAPRRAAPCPARRGR